MSGVEARARRGREKLHRGFGLTFSAGFALPGIPEVAGNADLWLELCPRATIEAAWSGGAPGPSAVETKLDGGLYRAERGLDGDHHFSYDETDAFHLSPDGRKLLCAPANLAEAAWRRVLLDSVLATVAMLHGMEALHAAAVAGPGGIVAVVGRTGGGKTTLACELVSRGLPLVSDDILTLERTLGGSVIGHPAPPVMNVPTAKAVHELGTRLADLGDETWVAVDRHATEPRRVAALCLLDRRLGAQPQVRAGATNAADLIVHTLHSGRDPERMQARFELVADLAAQAPVFLLEAEPTTSPAHLADLAEAAIPALRPLSAGSVR